jgi:hypothetical protein
VPSLQASILLAGLIGAIKTSDVILRTFGGGRAAVRGLLAQAAMLMAETLVFLWLYLGASA